MRPVYMIAACRTPVAPRGGASAQIELHDLGAAVIAAVLQRAGRAAGAVEGVIMGSALCAGGNAARLAALAAGLPDNVPALTIDTQCCSGLDAIGLAASRIASGQARVMIAGGMESFSRAPLRAVRPRNKGEAPQFYDRPPFAPWPERDPDLAQTAARLAAMRGYTRDMQEAFAIASHAKALAVRPESGEIIPVAGLARDAFPRKLTAQVCARLPVLAGYEAHGLSAATIACEADAAAAVLLVCAEMVEELALGHGAFRIEACESAGGDPAMPALAPAAAIARALEKAGVEPQDLASIELMEAYAAQAMANIADAGLPADKINCGGGALARGHPIGASGAILAVRLFHELQGAPRGSAGLAAIAAAGGLASALVLRRP